MVLLFPPAEPFGASAPHPPQRVRWGTYPRGGNVINLSIDHRAVGGDAHIAPRGMVSFWYHTAANS